jgi:hypothetical protein
VWEVSLLTAARQLLKGFRRRIAVRLMVLAEFVPAIRIRALGCSGIILAPLLRKLLQSLLFGEAAAVVHRFVEAPVALDRDRACANIVQRAATTTPRSQSHLALPPSQGSARRTPP